MTYDFFIGPTQVETIDYLLAAASTGIAVNLLCMMYYVGLMPSRTIQFGVRRRKRFLDPSSSLISDEKFENFYSLIQHILYFKKNGTEEKEDNSGMIQHMINEVNNE